MTVDSPLTLEQTTHPSVRIHARYSGLLSGPRRGWDRFLRTSVRRFGDKPRCNGALGRNGTRLVSTSRLGGFWIGKHKRPAWNAVVASRAGTFCLQRCEVQDGRTRPPNSSSQCFQKLQCFWLQSSDCRFGQYIPDPMAFCAIGYRTCVARMSGSSTV